MDGTLRKTLQLSVLENLLNGWFGLRPPPSTPALNDILSPEPVDSSASSEASAGQRADLVSVFLHAMRGDLAELENAVRQQDPDRADRIAYRMRGPKLV